MKAAFSIVAGTASLVALLVAAVALPFIEAFGVDKGIVKRGQGR